MDHERGLVIDDVLGGIQARLSLEGTVLEQRAAELKTESYKLARQRAFLREERRKVGDTVWYVYPRVVRGRFTLLCFLPSAAASLWLGL